MRIKGEIEIWDVKRGELLVKNHNMFVQSGINALAAIVGGEEMGLPKYIAAGTSAEAPIPGDTSLQGEELGRKPFEVEEIGDGFVKFKAEFKAGEATGNWEEVGVFSEEEGGTLWSRALTGTYAKRDRDEFRIYWTYTFVDVSYEEGE